MERRPLLGDLLCHRCWNLRIYAIKTGGCLFRAGRYLSREPNLMRAFIPEPAELELIPDAMEASEAAIADLNLASILETIRVRELTITPLMKEILQSSPSSHWGINE